MPALAKAADYQEQVLKSLGRLPPFSPVLNRLLATLSNEDASFAKIADLIEKDTVLAGNVLRLVNSALYARRGTVNSVRHAVSLLGIDKLRNATLGMSVFRMWNNVRTPPGWSMARFNLHSVAVAILSDQIAQRARIQYPEGAFIAGLFHDIGRLLIAVGLKEEYAQIEKLYAEGDRPLRDCETSVLGWNHQELSAQALAIWNLPEPIRVAVRYHHEPDNDPTPVEDSETRLSRLIYLADQYINSTGASIHTALSNSDQPIPDPLAQLTIPGERASLLEEFQSEFDTIKAMF
jgi:HD-like signal output (HDOD) protein